VVILKVRRLKERNVLVGQDLCSMSVPHFR